ncbi:MAG: complex I subunit 5 family protein [Phycisphaerae bacterium]
MPPLHQLAPLPVILPLFVAAIFAAIGSHIPRRLLDSFALLTTAGMTAIDCLLIKASADSTIIYWFGNWAPQFLPNAPTHKFPVGICFSIDPIGAGLAALVALLSTAAFAFSWYYFEQVKSLYHALMLAFAAAMTGLCLTGDLFNLFVWFELMTVAAVALCGYKSEESTSLLGSLNFAVMNTAAAFLSLAGVAFLYARTGTLNMAEVGRSLASHPPGSAFLLITFLFISAGFLVKMAVVPFQFWLADAHAVAPTPVCVLFSGVMVELGLYAIARLHWLVFSPAFNLHAEHAIRHLFLGIGAATAVIGALYAYSQRHLKRMLAFSTISHIGIMVTGFALLDPDALTGAAVYIVGHGMVKGALFLGAGILLHRCGSVDEYDLRGKGGNLKLLAVILVIGALALAGMPPFATFFGESLTDDTASKLHIEWLAPVKLIAEAFTAAAVLRFSARLFLNLGPRREATVRGAPHIPMDKETASSHDKTPFFMWLPALLLLALAAFIAIPHDWRNDTSDAAHHFENASQLAAVTLDRAPDAYESLPPSPEAHFTLTNAITLALTLLLAALPLFPQLFGNRLNWRLSRILIPAIRPFRLLQSGNIGDYIAWFALGIAAYAGVLLLQSH